MQNWEIAGTTLELILPSYTGNGVMATLIASGTVKMNEIGESAGRVYCVYKRQYDR